MKHFHVRSWDGRVHAYIYVGPVRLTVFSSSWLLGKRRKRTTAGWLWHWSVRAGLPAIVISSFYFHPYWLLDFLVSILRRFHG